MPEFEIENFEKNPILKNLLTIYCKNIYEENAIITDEYLLKEYNWLIENNNLNQLFEGEYLSNLHLLIYDVTSLKKQEKQTLNNVTIKV